MAIKISNHQIFISLVEDHPGNIPANSGQNHPHGLWKYEHKQRPQWPGKRYQSHIDGESSHGPQWHNDL